MGWKGVRVNQWVAIVYTLLPVYYLFFDVLSLYSSFSNFLLIWKGFVESSEIGFSRLSHDAYLRSLVILEWENTQMSKQVVPRNVNFESTGIPYVLVSVVVQGYSRMSSINRNVIFVYPLKSRRNWWFQLHRRGNG